MDEGDKLATHSRNADHVEVLPNLECSVNSPVHQITPVASASKSSTKVENILGHQIICSYVFTQHSFFMVA